SQRRGHRSRDGWQHLPLRHLPAHPRGHQARRGRKEGRAMSPLSRRALLRNAGLVIAFHVSRRGRAAQMAAPQEPRGDPNAFVRVATDESVTVQLAHSEMGQGVWTGLAMLIAEELDCDWTKVRVEHAPSAPIYAHPMFGMMATGGSTS